MLCYERVLFAIYILSLFTVLLLRRWWWWGYTALQTNNRRMIFYLRHTREKLLICIYVCVSCPVLMMMLLKWNVCYVGVVHYNETWEKSEIEREREEKTLEEKHKHIHITLAPITERFHSVLLTSHRCAWSSNTKKKKRHAKRRNSHVLPRYLSFSLSLSFSVFHMHTSYQL